MTGPGLYRHPSRLGIYLLLAVIAIVAVFPIWWIIATSLESAARAYSFPGALVPQGVITNYVTAWGLAPWVGFLMNSVIISATTAAGTVVVGLLAAYALVHLVGPRLSQLLFTGALATFLIPFYAIMIPDYVIMKDLGLLNTLAAQIIPFVGGGFAIFLFRQFIMTFPGELKEAATVDGVGNFGFLWWILVPNLRPAMATVAIYTFILSWNAFLWPLIVTSSPGVQPVQVGLADLVSTANGTDFTVLAAAAAITAFPIVVLYFFVQRQITESIARTGLKG